MSLISTAASDMISFEASSVDFEKGKVFSFILLTRTTTIANGYTIKYTRACAWFYK